MLVNCNSCHKKFLLPDNAITKKGRLVQCGSCGNKWTQFQVEAVSPIAEKPINIKISKSVGATKKNLYTAEYLKKKHGIDIKDANNQNKIKNSTVKIKSSFGFYSYIIVLFVFLMTLYGAFNLFEESIISMYPASESYINYFYEVIDIIKISLYELVG
jgi:predicted Zn finger-like uncharacterized protein